MATLEVRSLATLPRPDGALLHDVAFALGDGQVAALLLAEDTAAAGLLRAICGLEMPGRGDVLLGGVSVLGLPPHRRRIGLVGGDPALFGDRDAWDNVGFGLRMGGWPKAGREARIAELLDVVDLADRGGARIDELAADERLRLALARALAPEPEALLLEEPLSGLEEAQRGPMRGRLAALLARVHVTTLVATRSLADAVALADMLVVMAHGRVLQAGPLADVLAQPVTAEAARLTGYQVLADGPVEDGHVIERGAGGIALPAAADFAGGATVMAHPSTVLAVPAGAGLGCGVRGFVRRTRPEGPAAVLEVDLGERTVEARWEWDLVPPPIGTGVEIAVRPGTLRFFGTPRPANEPPPPLDVAPDIERRPNRVAVAAGSAAGGQELPARTPRQRVLDPLVKKNGHGPGFVRPPLQERVPGTAPDAPDSTAVAPEAAPPRVERVTRHPDMPSFD
ncbi:MAG: ATP-binding cassette domain-containing protein [Dehalococcoidia bacterium]|nr:ATP-binding cassette domain-containing protein [Dehalococcoidia bacterium]